MTSGETKWTDAVERQTDKMTKLITQLIRLSKMDEESVKHEMNDFSYYLSQKYSQNNSTLYKKTGFPRSYRSFSMVLFKYFFKNNYINNQKTAFSAVFKN